MKYTYDPKVPTQLKKTQQWFAGIITQPLNEDDSINSISPSGNFIEEEAKNFISPGPKLQPAQRIEIYNQQYWWRLLKILHENFPLLVRLFGYSDFNQSIAIPYLVKYPSDHWSIDLLGNKLYQWIEEEYQEKDKPLVLKAAQADWAYVEAFFADHFSTLSQLEIEDENLLTKVLYLQPHIKLFKLDCNLFPFRMEFLKQEPEYWLENDFPVLSRDKSYHFIVYRTLKNHIAYDELNPAAFAFLQRFQTGCSLEKACTWLEEPQNETICEEALMNIHLWMQKWFFYQWFTVSKKIACK